MTDVLKELVNIFNPLIKTNEEIEDSIIRGKSLNTTVYAYTTATKSTAFGFSQIIWKCIHDAAIFSKCL
jgi:hypothetical protein